MKGLRITSASATGRVKVLAWKWLDVIHVMSALLLIMPDATLVRTMLGLFVSFFGWHPAGVCLGATTEIVEFSWGCECPGTTRARKPTDRPCAVRLTRRVGEPFGFENRGFTQHPAERGARTDRRDVAFL